MKRKLALLVPVAGAAAALAVILSGSASGGSTPIFIVHDAVSGKLQPQSIAVKVNGKTVNRRLPWLSAGLLQSAADANRIDQAGGLGNVPDPLSDGQLIFGTSPKSALGCGGRNTDGNVRVNEDCSFRRQAEEGIASSPADSTNLLAGMNDSRVGFNQCGIGWSTDSGATWGDLLPPFRQHLNDPAVDGPNTIIGGAGTLHTYDADSDPGVAFDSTGRGFFDCVAFDLFDNASMVWVRSSPAAAKGSFFANLPLVGRTGIVVEDNTGSGATTSVAHDKPFIATDTSSATGGDRLAGHEDNVYVTWTVFFANNKCGGSHPGGGYCQSPIFGSMSTDHGNTWSAPEEISGNSPALCSFGNAFDPTLNPNDCNFSQGSDPVVLPNGKLVVTFNNGNTAAGNPNGQQLAVVCSPNNTTLKLNCGSPHLVGADVITTDPGNPAHSEPLCDVGRGPEECVPGQVIRTNDFPRIAASSDGKLYVTWQDFESGSEYDIELAKSTDGGTSWTELTSTTSEHYVNPDTGAHHYMPAIRVDPGTGNIVISYYSTPTGGGTSLANNGTASCAANNPKNATYVVSAGTSVPFTTATVSPSFPPPDGIQCGFNGDYSGLTVTPDHMAHPIWSDTRNSAIVSPSQGVLHDEDIFTDSVTQPGP